MDQKNETTVDAGESTEALRQQGKNALHRPEKSAKQGQGPERTGEGDSSVERGQRPGLARGRLSVVSQRLTQRVVG